MHTVQLADARILGTIGRCAVEAAMHEVDLRDHSLHVFRFVRDPSVKQRSAFLRALTLPHGCTYIVDVRRLAPCLAQEIPTMLDRDRPGLIKQTLRPIFKTAAELQRKVMDPDIWQACGWLDQQLDGQAA